MQEQPHRQHMTIIAIHPAWVGRYPFTGSRVFDEEGGVSQIISCEQFKFRNYNSKHIADFLAFMSQ